MTQSSGVFTFPSTGYWWINYRVVAVGNSDGDIRYAGGTIKVTTDNSTYSNVATGYNGCNNHGLDYYMTTSMDFIFDVTSTTNCKVKFNFGASVSGTTCQGDTNENRTCMTFIRLGNT